MSVLVAQPQPSLAEHPAELQTTARSTSWQRLWSFCKRPAVFISGLAFLALLIHGYHPYVDDAAIYVAGIEKIIDPSLFPAHAEYVLPHLRHSLFSYALGWLIRGLHVPLAYALFTTYLASLWLMLFACWRLACVLFVTPRARWGALLLITAALTLPVAGSAIFFIDPYLTARSFSTPATLFAIAYAVERRMLAAGLCLLAAFVLHPLMAAYAIGYVIALVLLRRRRWGWLAGIALAVMAAGFAFSHAGPMLGASPAYRIAAISRSYFFLNQWAWFEVFGLFPPLVAAVIYLSRHDFSLRSNYARISAASLYVGTIAILFAVFFARTDASFLLARLQPLRAFQLIYILFFLLLGSLLGQYVFRRDWWLGVAGFSLIAGIMFTAQLFIYPSLRHIEWPWSTTQNPWEQAFLWVRANTPRDAYFALDPHYQSQPHEDTVGFRAMAQRSVLPDWGKDGGVAAIDPALAQQWWKEVTATESFPQWIDPQRIRMLTPYGVNWILLSASASTHFACPYQNSAVKVCRLPIDSTALGSPSLSFTLGR